MPLIPLPFIATAILCLLLLRIAPRGRAIWMLAVLIALYAAQSALIGVRWGYGVAWLGPIIQAVAPVLPVAAWLAFAQLGRSLQRRDLWHGLVPLLAWSGLVLGTDLADAIGVVASLAYGAALVWRIRAPDAEFGAARVDAGRTVLKAAGLTGIMLIGAALVDIYIVIDFIRSGGQGVSVTLAAAQVAALCLIALAIGVAGDAVPNGQVAESPAPPQPAAADEDTAAAVDALFAAEALHTDMDLSLRKVARKLGLPDRAVSRAINSARGQTFKQYVNAHRVAAAKRLLRDTALPVIDVGMDAGFLSKSNFNRAFLEATGQTPSAFRAAQTARDA